MIDLKNFVIDNLSEITGLTVRNAYDQREAKYPMATVSQMDNYELPRYTTLDGVETVSAIPFQVDYYARNMTIDGEKMTAADAAEYFRLKGDDVMQSVNGMRRTSAPNPIPHTTDKTVMRAISRYDCMVFLETGDIFKK